MSNANILVSYRFFHYFFFFSVTYKFFDSLTVPCLLDKLFQFVRAMFDKCISTMITLQPTNKEISFFFIQLLFILLIQLNMQNVRLDFSKMHSVQIGVQRK